MEYTKCWLEYRRLYECRDSMAAYFCNTKGSIIDNIRKELSIALSSLYGLRLKKAENKEEVERAELCISLLLEEGLSLKEGGYRLEAKEGKVCISASSKAGLLYGSFSFLRSLQVHRIKELREWTFLEEKEPSNPLRMLNHWDNMNGSIERGYSGTSFFFKNNKILGGRRIRDYLRMVASLGINAVVINNVNAGGAATHLISDTYYKKLQKMSELFTSFGIKLFLSINFAAPMELGGLSTADPLDSKVARWWEKKAGEIWENIPDFGGFLVKADSEGRPGPFTYGRNHAEGANMLAKAVNPFGGLIIWRCFVYNCRQDWRDKKTDRARAGYDNFMPMDGMFLDNVILQIKNGPMDFQVREPVSPLFGGLKSTNMMLEVQIAQEYTGQQRHVCYLLPWFEEILSFDTHCGKENSKISDIISGKTYGNSNCGITAVANTGNDYNWTGHDLAAANLYGFGRLSFDRKLNSEEIGREWIVQTFGREEKVEKNLLKILMMSWRTYEKYTSPLGVGWMVKPNTHYGPDVDGYEYDRWGTYHKADHKGIGMDRTKNGTGYSGQYNEPLALLYEDRKTCPEELILFFHHVEYEYVLSSGKTVLQHIYDTHFEGVREVEEFLELFRELKGMIEEGAYKRIEERLLMQAEHAKEWRDVINSYFYRKTGIEDKYGRTLY